MSIIDYPSEGRGLDDDLSYNGQDVSSIEYADRFRPIKRVPKARLAKSVLCGSNDVRYTIYLRPYEMNNLKKKEHYSNAGRKSNV